MRRLPLLALVLSVALAAAPSANADPLCDFDLATHTITYALETGGAPNIQRGGLGANEIFVGKDGGNANDLCQDPDPPNDIATVSNTDTIKLTGTADPGLFNNDDLAFGFQNGKLAPGFTDEGDGSSEIEISAPDSTFSWYVRVGQGNDVGTSSLDDHFRAGRSGINFNSNETSPDVDLILGNGISGVEFFGGLGNDVLSTEGGGTLGAVIGSYTTLDGRDGNDTLTTGLNTNNSTFDLVPGPGNDEMHGNGARGFYGTTVSYAGATGAITLDLRLTAPQVIGADQGTDSLEGVYNADGGPAADNITGDAGVNWLGGGFTASGPGDTIHGDSGADSVNGSDGNDHLFGDDGDDSLNGLKGIDDVHGGNNNDTVDGDVTTSFHDELFGDDGDDSLQLDEGDDAVDGGNGTDKLTTFGATGGLNVDLLAGTGSAPGLGTNTLAGIENVQTTAFSDTVKGTDGPNDISGFLDAGGDNLEGRGGNDKLSAAGSDTVPNTIDGGAGDDTITGAQGPDDLKGGTGLDTILANGGDDTLSGPADGVLDTLSCGPGTDTVTSYDSGLDVLTNCESSVAGTPFTPGGTTTAPGGSTTGGSPTPTPAPDPLANAATACLTIPQVARDRSVNAPGGGKVTLVTRQVDDPANPLKASVKASGGAGVRSVTYTINGRPLVAARAAAVAPGGVPVGVLKIGSRANKIVATVVLRNGKTVKVTQLLVVLRCPLPAVTCKRQADGRSLSCATKTPLGAIRVRVTMLGAAGQKASGSAAVKRGRYTATVRSSSPLPAGRYLFKHVATTRKPGEKLFMTRIIVVP